MALLTLEGGSCHLDLLLEGNVVVCMAIAGNNDCQLCMFGGGGVTVP